MTSDEIRSKFFKFFEKRGHKIIPSASLVPENDPSVLFNTAGMQPLVPYLLGESHPMGKRLANAQKCVRTQDIEEVGDNTHDTFFEMLGNWSLGDYFKKDAITWSYNFLTSKEEGLGLPAERLYFTCFEGDENAPKDIESADVWQSLGISERRIYFLGAKDNWWSPGENGPCGPDTEMFYDLTGTLGEMNRAEFLKACDEQKVVEIWNDVFMEYKKKDGKIVGKLKKQNVDTGAGLERVAMVMQHADNIFSTDLFKPIMATINQFTDSKNERAKRIVVDHVRTSVFMIADGVAPANTHRGYILRRLLRRAVRYANVLGLKHGSLFWLAEAVIEKYQNVYPELLENTAIIKKEIDREESKFRETLERGMKEFEKGADPFVLATTYGFPIELTVELSKEKDKAVDLEEFRKKMKEHQELSQIASAGMFKGGLANHNQKTVRLHTAHHLLLAALQNVVASAIKQRGSNITEERLRMDFTCDHKLTEEEKQKVEAWVNDKISKGYKVVRREMALEEAKNIGAEMEFGAKYGERVSVYFIEDNAGKVVSKEFCGGPHVANTSELTNFKILKEEAVSGGLRRIKAILKD